MRSYKEKWQENIWKALLYISKEKNIKKNDIIAEIPPDPDLGDIAFPMFQFAKYLRISPKDIAKKVADFFKSDEFLKTDVHNAQIELAGPYINIKLKKEEIISEVITTINQMARAYGKGEKLAGQRIMIEYSCPNTNKPLHLGHLRNDSIGESLSRILKANGAEVFKVNLINNRGIHICKSMLAYKEYGNNKNPIDDKLKPDHFVGKYYVLFNEKVKDNPALEEEARCMLKAWEMGDKEITGLWEKMNKWAISGIKETYKETGISFDKYYFESETYLSGKKEVHKGYKNNIFYKKEDNSIWIDLTPYSLDHKVLLRGDGTSLYITQDIGTAIKRYKDWPFDNLIYVVASEQNYHFKVLFKVLELLGFSWAKNLYHLSYGMVNLPDGKMKSREGTVVDADNLLEELRSLAKKEIILREREKEIQNIDSISKKIALGALNYYLLVTTPIKDMIFNPDESISFTGNTGPYLQYTGARICSILRKYQKKKENFKGGRFSANLLIVKEEWEIVKLISSYPEQVEAAAISFNPSIIALFIYNLAKTFSRYYHDNPVLHNEDPNLVISRIKLLNAIKEVFINAFELLGIPFLTKM